MAKLRLLVPEATRNYVKNPSARFDLTGWTGKGVTYLWLDEFTTPVSAPIPARNSEPGPGGTVVIIDTGNYYSIANGKWVCSGKTTDYADPAFRSRDAYTRQNGLAFYAKLDYTSGDTHWGVRDNTGGAAVLGFYITNTITYAILPSLAYINLDARGTEFMLVCRNNGYYWIVKLSGVWTLIYVDYNPSYVPASFYGGSRVGAVVGQNWSWEKVAAFMLYGPFDDGEYGLATNYVPVPASGSTATMTADGFVNMFWTPAAAETMDIMFRRTDDNNCWIIRCDQAGSTIKLFQKQAGVETERNSAAQTWTAGTQYRLSIRALTQTCKSFVNAVLKNDYSSVTMAFNQTATGAKVTGFTTAADLATFPRVIPANALAEISRYV